MKTHKKTLKTALAIAILAAFLGAPSAFAGEGHDGKDFVEKKIERMKKNLDLTDDQVAQIRPILERKSAEMKALMERTQSEIAAVLTEEQKAKLEKQKEEWKEKREERKDRKRHSKENHKHDGDE